MEHDRHLIAALMASAATRADTSDRFNAIAAEWLRRWRPKTSLVALPQCTCPAGHCEACN
jgi:hypothetical protein